MSHLHIQKLKYQMQDFVTYVSLPVAAFSHIKGPEGNSNFSIIVFTPPHSSFMTNMFTIKEPCSYHQAKQDINWIHAMNKELEALEKNDTGQLTSLPKGKKSISCKWVYRIKYHVNGIVD